MKYISYLINMDPVDIRIYWSKVLSLKGITSHCLQCLKSIISLLCCYGINDWSDIHQDITSSLPSNQPKKYISIRSGDSYISTLHESKLIQYFDKISYGSDTSTASKKSLTKAGILLCSYLYGMRPTQIASVRTKDVRIWNSTGLDKSVHISFKMVKQKTNSRSTFLTRKVKQEWAPIIIKQFENIQSVDSSKNKRLFDVTSANKVTNIIIELTKIITGVSINANKLRHTAAQRLVDAGASQEELAEFLGHADITTGLVYFEHSVNQAERVNKALGISDIYSEVQTIAKNKYISQYQLEKLKGEQQISGVPHGIPITGIGGCSKGQPACPYNPITSCYGCHKFMPIDDINSHQKVLDGMREVVKAFEKSSRESNQSPAFMQLINTITNIQGVIYDLKDKNA